MKKRVVDTTSFYKSAFCPSTEGLAVLSSGKILSPDETPPQMVERVVHDLAQAEKHFNVPLQETMSFANNLGSLIDSGHIVLSTPIMTNAGREQQRPLSACTVPPVDLRGDLSQVRNVVDAYHQEAMGTGFDLTNVEDPVSVLLYLNEIAVKGAQSGKEDRPVGNMATLRIDHPRIAEFITSKVSRRDHLWKFNISIDVPEKFWTALKSNEPWTLADGKVVSAKDLFHLIAQSAHTCADPGIICLDRLNADNPTPGVGLYSSTAPCAEVGLVPGETCQFGYLNLAKFLDTKSGKIDYQKLSDASHTLVRALDNALELSVRRYSVKESAKIMSEKRKIGVGVCGFADMLAHMGIPYDSDQARTLGRDTLAFINYQTKHASHNLAKDRGSFGAMNLMEGNRYKENPGFLEEKYGNLNTALVSGEDWKALGKKIRNTGLLRNCSTTALPPTGRSALVVSASACVEPLFTLISDSKIHPAIAKKLKKHRLHKPEIISHIESTGSCQKITSLPEKMRHIFKTATEIHPTGHLSMISSILSCVDESISKTINLPALATVEDIEDIYLRAYDSGLKGMTIYRNGSCESQPKRVAG